MLRQRSPPPLMWLRSEPKSQSVLTATSTEELGYFPPENLSRQECSAILNYLSVNKMNKQPREGTGNHPRVQSTVGRHKTNEKGLEQRVSSFLGREDT